VAILFPVSVLSNVNLYRSIFIVVSLLFLLTKCVNNNHYNRRYWLCKVGSNIPLSAHRTVSSSVMTRR
jgi:hypothetical protein